MAHKIIDLVPYNHEWPQHYEEEADNLRAILGSSCIEIHHIGSTSVPGLIAKNNIDILLVCSDLKDSLKLIDYGYVFKGELNIPLRFFFSYNREQIKVNLHVCMPENGFIGLNLHFRDMLRSDAALRNQYAKLKLQLKSDPEIGKRERGVFSRYALRKNTFIKSVIRDGGYQGESLVFCLHDEEWDAYRTMSQDNDTIDEKNFYYLCLYRGAEIVSTARISQNDMLGNVEIFSEIGGEDSKGVLFRHITRMISFYNDTSVNKV